MDIRKIEKMKEKKECIISPIFYMGNKKKLINKGLIDLFPKNINKFVDLFAGSVIVSMNVDAKKYFVNDTSIYLYDLYNMFKVFSAETIIQHIKNRIEEYSLAKERTSHKVFEDDRVKRYKVAYVKFRDFYNKSDRFILDFYTLMFYSFSQQFRFNSKGDFNMPCGNDCFTFKNEEYIKNGTRFFKHNNVIVQNGDFRTFNVEELNKDDFIYLDPPYLNTTAIYNENSGWTEKDENDLYDLCEKLHMKDIKFGISNVFENKGIKNQKLIDWCKENNWNIYFFDRVAYSACGKGNSNAKEVFISNY